VIVLLVTADVVPSLLIISNQTKEKTPSSETSVLTRSTQYRIPEDGILQYSMIKLEAFVRQIKHRDGRNANLVEM
jgi:hypothetical protein